MKIEDLYAGYPKVEVLKGLSADFLPGEINGLVGMNGAGKTTLLRTIFGSHRPKKGEITMLGKSIDNRQISFLETSNFFYPKIKGREYLEIFKQSNPDFDIQKWNALFELPLNRLVDDYSTGMKKKLAFLGVIGLNKPILLLDEPFNGVDLESNEIIKLVLKRLKESGKTIIISSHILETLTSLCEQISILYEGQIELTRKRTEFEGIRQYLEDRIGKRASNLMDHIFNES